MDRLSTTEFRGKVIQHPYNLAGVIRLFFQAIGRITPKQSKIRPFICRLMSLKQVNIFASGDHRNTVTPVIAEASDRVVVHRWGIDDVTCTPLSR